MYRQNKTRLKVTHCVIFYSKNYKGGIQKYVEEITREQNKTLTAKVMTTDEFSAKDNDFPALRTKSWGVLLRTPMSPGLLRRKYYQDANLLHFHGPNPLLDLAARASNKPYVITLHNSFPLPRRGYQLANAVAKKLLERTLEKAKRIFIHQENFLPTMQLQPGKIKNWREKIKIIHPGVDHTVFHPSKIKKENTIVFMAHVRPEKGLHILQKSLRYIKDKKNLEVQLLVTSSYRGNYLPREFAAIEKIMNKKCVLKENPAQEEIITTLQQAGCFVCPSLGLESWNLAMLEAAACGAPIVRTDLPGLSWLHPPACLIARSGDAQDLAQKISTALQQKETLGRNAWHAAREFSWQQTARQLIDEYYEVLD